MEEQSSGRIYTSQVKDFLVKDLKFKKKAIEMIEFFQRSHH